jgi:membrane protein
VSLHELLVRFLPTGSDGAESGAFETVERVVAGLLARRGRLTVVGLPLFLWFSTRLFGGLRVALNEVFDTDERRPWPVAKLLDLFLVCVAGVFLIAGGLLAAYQARNADMLSHNFLVSWAWRLSIETITFGLGIGMFFVIFKLLPSRRIDWRTALVAAAFSSLGFEVAKWLYGLFVTKFVTFDRLASDANVVAAFLFLQWVYATAYLFLLGGEVGVTYDLIRMRRAQRVQLG